MRKHKIAEKEGNTNLSIQQRQAASTLPLAARRSAMSAPPPPLKLNAAMKKLTERTEKSPTPPPYPLYRIAQPETAAK
jgi:hypothetical protein